MTIQDAIEEICVREPLFTSLVLGLEPVQDNEGCPTLGTDGVHLFYNTDFLDTLNQEETCAVVLHEVLHCAFAHVWRRGNRDMFRWNMATDFAINTVVDETFKLPKGALLDQKYYGMAAEDIYDSLEGEGGKKQSWCEKEGWEGSGKGKGKGKAGQESDEEGDEEGDSLLDRILGKKKKKKKKKASGMSKAAKEQKWKDLMERSILNNYGKTAGSLRRMIENTHYVPVLDWASLVAGLLSEDENDYTFSTPDRRFLDGDIIMPGQFSVDKLKDVIFAYDTSGSIEEDDLKAFYHETLALFENFSSFQGWVAICDADLHSFKEADPQKSFEDFDFYGGGGTDFNPVFDEIKRRGLKPKGLFYFTDTEGSFPNEEPPYPVFWLVRSRVGENYPLNVPFGQVIRFLGR